MTRRETQSAAETKAFAAEITSALAPGAVVALFGELGSGKTVFVVGALESMGRAGVVFSPTFAIVNEYETPRGLVAHFDMYRIETEADLFSSGFYDYLDRGATMFIEWSENIDYALPRDALRIHFSRGQTEDARVITVETEPTP